MKDHTHVWGIEEMASMLEVSRSGYYKFLGFSPSQRSKENDQLSDALKKIDEANKGRYGSPRIHKVLLKEGDLCSRKRVSRLMALQGLKGQLRKRFKCTTTVDKEAIFSPNLLQQDFKSSSPNEKRVSDITCRSLDLI